MGTKHHVDLCGRSVQAATADLKLASGAAWAWVIAAGLIGVEGHRDGLA